MWFSTATVYQIHDTPTLALSELEDALQQLAFRPLGGSEARRLGWCAPSGRASTQLAHEVNGQRLITLLHQERLLPPGVVREEVEERAEAIESREGRALCRQEKIALKEQVYEELLPRAFVRTKRIAAWWDTRRNRLIVNTGARKRAEEVLDLLRETLGSLKVTPLSTHTLPMRGMTEWLGEPGSRPGWLTMGDKVELKAKGDDGVVRARQVDLDSDEVQQLLEGGRHVSQLAIVAQGQAAFVLHDDLTLKALRFDDAVIDEAQQSHDDDNPLVRLETDFFLMTQALSDVIDQVVASLGGIATPHEATDTQASNQEPKPPTHETPAATPSEDPLYGVAVDYVKTTRLASTSGLQRVLRVGYNRAAHLISDLERNGIISPQDDQGHRHVIE